MWKAIVCATECESDYYKMVNANEIGICVPNTSPKEQPMQSSLYRGPKRLRQIGENARVLGAKYYSSTHNVRKYIRIVRRSMCWGGTCFVIKLCRYWGPVRLATLL